MAEIEVLLDFGTPYVRLDDYNAMKERYWRQAGLTQTADDEAAKWKEHARAAVARAEAAEAEAVDLHRQLAEMAAVMEEIEAERLALAARVAELESQLAAQQWRPVTEDWPPYNERVIIGHGGGYGGGWSAFARRVRTDNRDGDDWLTDDDTTLAFESAVGAMRRPLPPAAQEPTP